MNARCHVVSLVVLAALPLRAAGADPVPTGTRATAARAEAEAFALLEERRDCDAARSFLRAHALSPDERLVVNAALALERNGSRAEAIELLAQVRGTPAGDAVDERAAALAAAVGAEGPGAACVAPAAAAPPGVSLLPAGLAALAGGLVVAGSTIGTWWWLNFDVLGREDSSGDAKGAALVARDPVLIAGGSIAGALVVAGAVLVPMSFQLQEPQ